MTKLSVLALVLLGLALILRSEVMSAVSLALLLAIGISTLWLRRIERGVRIEREAPAILTLGEEASVALVLRNLSLLRVPWLEVRDSVPLGLRLTPPVPAVVTLAAGAEHRVIFAIRGARRGWYKLGPVRVVLGDVLGLRKVRLMVPAAHVTVYPRVLPLQTLGLPATLAYGPLRPHGAGQRTEDPSRPAGVRQYVPGDDVRRLDWKASARGTGLLVRRADPSIAPETTLALSFGRREYPAQSLHDSMERAVVVAASLSMALLARKLPICLVSNGFDPQAEQVGLCVPFAKGDLQRRLVLSALGRIAPSDGPELQPILGAQQLPWGGTIILIISDLTTDLLPELAALRRRGQQIVVVLVEGTLSGLALARQQRLTAYSADRAGMPVPERSL